MSVKLMSRVFELEFENPFDKWVLVVLADFASDDGRNAYPSVATMARRASMSDRAVQRSIKKLIKGGYIAQDGSWKSNNGPIKRYRILLDKLTGDHQSPVTVSRPPVTTSHPTGDCQSLTGDHQSPNPSLTINKPSVPEEREAADAGDPPPGISPSGDSSPSDASPTSSPQFKIVAAMGKSLTPSAVMRINEQCTDLKRLQAVVDYCQLLPKCSIPAMLEIYGEWPTHRHNPEAKHTTSGTQKPGKSRQSKSGTFRREQVPPRNGLQSEIDACRRNAKNARDRGDVVKAEKWEAAAEKLTAQLAQP